MAFYAMGYRTPTHHPGYGPRVRNRDPVRRPVRRDQGDAGGLPPDRRKTPERSHPIRRDHPTRAIRQRQGGRPARVAVSMLHGTLTVWCAMVAFGKKLSFDLGDWMTVQGWGAVDRSGLSNDGGRRAVAESLSERRTGPPPSLTFTSQRTMRAAQRQDATATASDCHCIRKTASANCCRIASRCAQQRLFHHWLPSKMASAVVAFVVPLRSRARTPKASAMTDLYVKLGCMRTAR